MAIAPNEAIPQVDLIYKIEDKPSFKDAVFAAFQHLHGSFRFGGIHLYPM